MTTFRVSTPRPVFGPGRLLIVLGAALLLLGARASSSRAAPADDNAVDTFRRVLTDFSLEDKDRVEQLKQLYPKLTLTQLSRVLQLHELQVPDKIHTDAWNAAGELFRAKAQAILNPDGTPDVNRLRLMAAVAGLIGETSDNALKLETIATPIGGVRRQLADLTPDLIRLAENAALTDQSQGDRRQAAIQARQAAVLALGKVPPAPGPVPWMEIPAEEKPEEKDKREEAQREKDRENKAARLKQLADAFSVLLSDKEDEIRLAAARAMQAQINRVADQARSPSLGLNARLEFSTIGGAFVPLAAGKGLKQAPAVREINLATCKRVSAAMTEMLPDPRQALYVGLEIKPADLRAEFLKLKGIFTPLLVAFNANADSLADAATDPNPFVRVQALRLFDDLAILQRRIEKQERVPGGPEPITTPPKPVDNPDKKDGNVGEPRLRAVAGSAPAPAPPVAADPLAETLRKSKPAVQRALSDKVPDARLEGIYIVEAMGTDAYFAIDDVIKLLDDPDKFVRWSAVRTLGGLAAQHSPSQVKAAVAGMNEVLTDQEVDLRVAAARSLAAFGPRAAAAAPRLTRMITQSQVPAALYLPPSPDTDPEILKGDPDVRIAAIQAVEVIDGTNALPAALTALKDPSFSVRQTAAAMIGRVGKTLPAEKREELKRALTVALTDPQGEVRQAAIDALLGLNEK